MKNNNNISDKEIDLKQMFTILWKSKVYLFSIISIFTIAALIYSFSLPNIYKSKALLSPVGEQSAIGSSSRSLGGIASLAGINLSPDANGNNSVKALDKLNSLSFFANNILPNIYLPDLMAIKSWNAATNTIVYDKNLFDHTTQTWIRDFKYPQTQIPSAQESFEIFINEHLSVSEDQDTFFVTISVKHQSPFVAQAWTQLIVKELNNFFSVKDKAEAQGAVDYLNAQIAQTSFTEVKLAIAELLQQKTQQLSLIEVSDFYVFDYIDPPAVMEKKSEPKRAVILIIGIFLGSMFGIFIVLIRHYFFNKQPY